MPTASFFKGASLSSYVDPDTLLIDPKRVEEKITSRTKAIVAVDYAGHPCDYDSLNALAGQYRLKLVADACHSLGATLKNRPVGSLADMSAFSFHPVKHITTGEGGMVTTNDAAFAQRMRRFRNHGITTDHRERHSHGEWFYEMVDLGYNYRITDFQCALGMSQLLKLNAWIERRQRIAGRYSEAFEKVAGIRPLQVRPQVSHAYHLFVVRLDAQSTGVTRNQLFRTLREQGIGANVHYIPVHLHPYYRSRFNIGAGLCPVAEHAYEEILSLPIFPGMADEDVETVIDAVRKAVSS